MHFYTAGKIWHAPKFRTLRDAMGLPVRARWIDAESDSDLVKNRKGDLWRMCFEDVRDSNFVLLYSEAWTEEQRGALVEVGMAYGMNKPVYAVGKCQSLGANEISDVAFTHYENWTWLPTDDLVKGTMLALGIELKKLRNIKAVA
jgi:hypothetical protein